MVDDLVYGRGDQVHNVHSVSVQRVRLRKNEREAQGFKLKGTHLGIARRTSSTSHFGMIRYVVGATKNLKHAMCKPYVW